jgi:endo-1,4-beta-xylanase
MPAGNSTLVVRGGTASQTGTNNGFYCSFWTSGSMYVTYSNGAGGAYTVDWQGNGDFIAGKGWNPGSAWCMSCAAYTAVWLIGGCSSTISYKASWGPNPGANVYLSVYGWFMNPLVEYYIVESSGS